METYQLNYKPLEVWTGKLPEIPVAKNNELQRTDEWFKKRLGRFTGSKISDLMTCTKSTAKMEWGRPEKLIDFGETAMKYIYGRAKERQRQKVVHLISTSAMKYGTENESVVFALLEKKHPDWKFEKVEFLEFIEGVAGASPDGKVITDSDTIGLEMKCACDWNGVYDRHEEETSQGSTDFWQLQAEMLALKVKSILYAVAEPSENIFEPNITDVSEKFVDASIVHQQAIIGRCLIGDAAIKLYLSGVNFHEAIRMACSEYKDTAY